MHIEGRDTPSPSRSYTFSLFSILHGYQASIKLMFIGFEAPM